MRCSTFRGPTDRWHDGLISYILWEHKVEEHFGLSLLYWQLAAFFVVHRDHDIGPRSIVQSRIKCYPFRDGKKLTQLGQEGGGGETVWFQCWFLLKLSGHKKSRWNHGFRAYHRRCPRGYCSQPQVGVCCVIQLNSTFPWPWQELTSTRGHGSLLSFRLRPSVGCGRGTRHGGWCGCIK